MRLVEDHDEVFGLHDLKRQWTGRYARHTRQQASRHRSVDAAARDEFEPPGFVLGLVRWRLATEGRSFGGRIGRPESGRLLFAEQQRLSPGHPDPGEVGLAVSRT